MDEEDKGLDAAKEKIINRRKSRFEQQERNKRWKDNLLESSSDQQYTNSTIAFYSNLPVRSKRKLKEKRLSVAGVKLSISVDNENNQSIDSYLNIYCNDFSMIVDDSYSSNGEGVIPELPETPNHSPMQDDDNEAVSRHSDISYDFIQPSPQKKVYIEIDSVINYVYELSQNNGISPANDEYTAFSLSDVDAKEGKLKERSFVFVIRKSVEFEDCWGWVYACSCTKEQIRFCNSISRRVPLKRKEFDDEYNKSCLHIKAASHLMAEFDSRNRIEPESHYKNTGEPGSDSPVFPILSTENVVSVWDQQKNDYGAITIIRNHFSCLCCPSSTSCSHIDILTSMEGSTKLPSNAERMLQCVKEEGSTSAAENQKTLSWQQIPFQRQSLNKERQFVSSLGDDDSFVLKPLLVPDLKCPNCGGKWSSDDPVKNDWVYSNAVAVFLDFGIFTAKVYCIKCATECSWYQYDGLEDVLINMGSYLVSHKILRRFMLCFLHGRMPIYVFHSIYVREKQAEGYADLASSFTYNKFKNAWYSYMELLDINIDTGFSCKICKEEPSVLIMDATSLSFRKEFMHWRSFLNKVDTNSDMLIPRKSQFKDRILISNKRCRSLLLRYAWSPRRKAKRLTGEEMEELMSILKTDCLEVHDLLSYIQACCIPIDHQYARESEKTKLETVPFTCPRVWMPFVEALGVATPVCGLIHQDEVLLTALENLVKANGAVSAEILGIVRTKFPVLHDIVSTFEKFQCPIALLPVLKILVEKSKKPFQDYNNVDAADDDLLLSEGEDPENLIYSHWPCLRQNRRRGKYSVDKKGSKKDTMSCHKTSKGHPTLLPGVFTMFCKHGMNHFLIYFYNGICCE
eukprot:gene8570-9483_t